MTAAGVAAGVLAGCTGFPTTGELDAQQDLAAVGGRFQQGMALLEKILVPSFSGAQIPLAQVVTIKSVLGPQEIKGERGLLVGYVTMNTRDRDEVSVEEEAEALLQSAVRDGRLKLSAGYYWEWSGQFENQVSAAKRMSILVPVCLFIMFVMLYLGFKRWWIAPIIYFGLLPIFWATGRGPRIRRDAANGDSERRRHGRERACDDLYRALPVLRGGGVEMETGTTKNNA